jgi:hypothetical protein
LYRESLKSCHRVNGNVRLGGATPPRPQRHRSSVMRRTVRGGACLWLAQDRRRPAEPQVLLPRGTPDRVCGPSAGELRLRDRIDCVSYLARWNKSESGEPISRQLAPNYWRPWWMRLAPAAPATAPPTGSMSGRPPGAVAWTVSTKPTVEQLRTSTFIL